LYYVNLSVLTGIERYSVVNTPLFRLEI
jgi:hypothetical protein